MHECWLLLFCHSGDYTRDFSACYTAIHIMGSNAEDALELVPNDPSTDPDKSDAEMQQIMLGISRNLNIPNPAFRMFLTVIGSLSGSDWIDPEKLEALYDEHEKQISALLLKAYQTGKYETIRRIGL